METSFLKQSRRDNTHEVQLTSYKVEGRSMGMKTKNSGRIMGLASIIVLVLAVLLTACNKPEKTHLSGTWRWTQTSGGIGGWYYTPESEGFEAEIVFKGSSFTLYKDGERVTSGTYHIDHDVDDRIYTDKRKGDEPFYSWFNIRFHLTDAQCKKMSEAFNGKISLGSFKFLASLGYSEAEGEFFSFCDQCCDGFCTTFVKK